MDPYIINDDTNVFVLGDTHGDFRGFFHKAADGKYDDSVVIHVGDVGVGFGDRLLPSLDIRLAGHNIRMMCIRGNHDDPSFFVDPSKSTPNVELLDDYSVIEYRNKKILLVGGAISIDRSMRTPGKSWWKDEVLVYEPDKVCKADILITHAAPPRMGPCDPEGIRWHLDNDRLSDDLWRDLQDERDLVARLIIESGASKHFCGHLHCSETKTLELGDHVVESRILNISEIIKLDL